MKKSSIFLVISIAIVVLAVFSIFNKTFSKIISYSNDEEFSALEVEEQDNFDFKALQQKIKSSSYINSIIGINGTVSTTINDDTLNVEIVGSGIKYSNEFMYSYNTLYADIFNITKLDEITYHIFDIAYSIKYINTNYALSKYLNENIGKLDDLDSLGILVNDKKIVMKTDRKLEFINFDTQYITKEMAEKNSQILKKEELVKFGNSKVKVIKTGTNDFMIISISEKDKISQNTFDSLINILGVVLDYNDIYNEFVNSHVNMKFKTEKNSNYYLEIEPEKEIYEKNYFKDEPMIRFTLYGK